MNREEKIKRNRNFRKEIHFYQIKKKELSDRATSRRKLAQAARELGSLLDPTKILHKLIETAQNIFPGETVHVTYGQNPDPVDRFVIQKKTAGSCAGGSF